MDKAKAPSRSSRSSKKAEDTTEDGGRARGRPLWRGSISFGLVNIPVALHNATRVEEMRFRLLRQSDLSPVNYKRVAQTDGKEVPWAQIVKGYEYEKNKFVVLKDEDFKRVDLEATDTIDLIDFVDLEEINPIFFYKPYYLQPMKGGGAAYSLLRKVLANTKKAGIAKVIIRTRQHLAAVKCNGRLLVLELMRFENELLPASSISVGGSKEPSAREYSMAESLVKQMSEKWEPSRYTDDYRSALMKLIDKKIAAGGKALPAKEPKTKPRSNVIDLAAVLAESLAEATGQSKSRADKSKKSGKARSPGKAA